MFDLIDAAQPLAGIRVADCVVVSTSCCRLRAKDGEVCSELWTFLEETPKLLVARTSLSQLVTRNQKDMFMFVCVFVCLFVCASVGLFVLAVYTCIFSCVLLIQSLTHSFCIHSFVSCYVLCTVLHIPAKIIAGTGVEVCQRKESLAAK